MINKNVKLGVLVLAAVTLFTATAFAATSQNEGYEALKQIMKEAKDVKPFSNATMNGTFKLTDNGKLIAYIAGEGKVNVDGKQASGKAQVNLMGKTQNLAFYKSAETTYLVDENNSKYYQLINTENALYNNRENCKMEYSNSECPMGKSQEALLDYFTGNLKSQFELSKNADGTKSITLDLNQDEIPAVVNLFAGVAVEKKNSNGFTVNETGEATANKYLLMEKFPFLKDFEGIENEMPKLKTNVKITGIAFKLEVDENNQPKAFEAKVTVTGNDENGAFHEVTMQGSTGISGINATSVDSLNTDGKILEAIDCTAFKCRE